jgi:hypothetical protein
VPRPVGGLDLDDSTAQEFSLRFSVLPGRIVYLGALRLDVLRKTVGLLVEDRQERDLAVVRAR